MHPTEIYNYFLPCGGAILGQDHLLNVSCQPSSSWPGMSTSIQSHFLAKHTQQDNSYIDASDNWNETVAHDSTQACQF